MRGGISCLAAAAACIAALATLIAIRPATGKAGARNVVRSGAAGTPPHAYLGFDTNDYPGDAALPQLRKTFSFAGYWLNAPPGGSRRPWTGKRALLRNSGFGLLVLFNGRLQRELNNPDRAATLGAIDAREAADAAAREGFRPDAVIFLDQEEGGEMEPEQMAYIEAWVKGLVGAGFHAGIYCSGMPASAGHGVLVTTAADIRARFWPREMGEQIAFFVYNDACPPSPGCAYSQEPPLPSASGIAFASVWQFAQSPRRGKYTGACRATYARDGNCYAPGAAAGAPFLDIESATTADPSGARQ